MKDALQKLIRFISVYTESLQKDNRLIVLIGVPIFLLGITFLVLRVTVFAGMDDLYGNILNILATVMIGTIELKSWYEFRKNKRNIANLNFIKDEISDEVLESSDDNKQSKTLESVYNQFFNVLQKNL